MGAAASSTISLLSVDAEVSAPPELRRIVTGLVSAVGVVCDDDICAGELDVTEALDAVDEPAASGFFGPDGAGVAESTEPSEGGAADGGPDDDSVDEPVELVSSASATPGVLATTVATPSVAANTPTRPIYVAYPIANS